MNRFAFVLALLLALVPAWVQADGVINGGFESGLDNWAIQAGTNVTVSTFNPYEGAKCIEVSVPAYPANYWDNQVRQEAIVESGTPLRIAYAGTGYDYMEFKLELSGWVDGQWVTSLWVGTHVPPDGQWRSISYGTLPCYGDRALRIECATQGTFRFDAVGFDPTPVQPTTWGNIKHLYH